MRATRQCVLSGLACVLTGLLAGCAGASSSGDSARTGTADRTDPGTSGASEDQSYTQAEALRRFFSTDRDWLARGLAGPNFGGRPYCGVDVLGMSADARRAYVWVFCQELYLSAGQVQEGTGVSVPVLVTISGSGAGTLVMSWRMPRDGSAYPSDIKAMFPAAVASRALAHDVHPSPSQKQLKAIASRELRTATSTLPSR